MANSRSKSTLDDRKGPAYGKREKQASPCKKSARGKTRARDNEISQFGYRRALLTLNEWEYWVEHSLGGKVRAMHFKVRGDRVLLTIKARYKERFVIAFVEGTSIMEALVHGAYLVSVGDLPWRHDKYP